MKSRTSELAVGIFVILFGIALFFLAMRVSGLVGTNISDSYEMSARTFFCHIDKSLYFCTVKSN